MISAYVETWLVDLYDICVCQDVIGWPLWYLRMLRRDWLTSMISAYVETWLVDLYDICVCWDVIGWPLWYLRMSRRDWLTFMISTYTNRWETSRQVQTITFLAVKTNTYIKINFCINFNHYTPDVIILDNFEQAFISGLLISLASFSRSCLLPWTLHIIVLFDTLHRDYGRDGRADDHIFFNFFVINHGSWKKGSKKIGDIFIFTIFR